MKRFAPVSIPILLFIALVGAFSQSDFVPTREANVHIVARHADGTVFVDQWIHNLRTTGGADWQANAMGTTGSQPAVQPTSP